MGFRLLLEQDELLNELKEAFKMSPSAQVRYFWRQLRKAALPAIPEKTRKQSTLDYGLAQLRWQRLSALSADSHVAAASLLKEELELLGKQGEQPSKVLSAAAAEEELSKVISQAPLRVQYRIFQELVVQHPDWLEVDEDCEEAPLKVVTGGKSK